MRILVLGDFCQRYRVDAEIRSGNYGNLFGDVRTLISSVDYSIVNFEFPLILNKRDAKPILKYGPNLKGTIESVYALKYAGFNCCTLANNHILDQGGQCCVDTKETLEKAGIDTVGAGSNLQEAERILYKSFNGETIAIINCCEHEFSIATSTSAGANPLNPIQQYYKIQEAKKKADYVLVIVHGGHEHFQLPSPRMQETYRFFIDAGADAVINHHQHCFSGYEFYKNKPIFYGLGNFLFDNSVNTDSKWNYGYAVSLNIQKNDIGYKIFPFEQCNAKPSVNFLKGEKRSDFDKSIKRINEVINDKDRLKTEICDYYKTCSKYELDMLEPYSGKVLNKLYSCNLLPRFIKGEKVRAIFNHIICESHRDRLLFALNLKH